MKPAPRSIGALAAGWASSAVPQLLTYLEAVESGATAFSWLTIAEGAVLSVITAGTAYLALRARPPADVAPAPESASPASDALDRAKLPRVVPEESPRQWKYGARSEQVLSELHPDLARVMRRALPLSPWDIALICGKRTEAEQRVLVEMGKSQTMDSMHRRDPACAVDFMVIGRDGGTWELEPFYVDVNDAIREAARLEGVELTHGIDWPNLVDAGHIELRRSAYPNIALA